jgi:hypothetical protein
MEMETLLIMKKWLVLRCLWLQKLQLQTNITFSFQIFDKYIFLIIICFEGYFIFYKQNMKKIFSLLGGICIVALSTISCAFAYTQEQQEAYQWAYKNKITTQSNIQAANLN